MATKWAAIINDEPPVWHDTFDDAWTDYHRFRMRPDCRTVTMVKESTNIEMLMEEVIPDV